jgi:hypothetical protein
MAPLEPSAAAVGTDVFYTASQMFLLSSDAGVSFTQPSYGAAGSIFPEGYEFVDQSAIWHPYVGRFVWAMIREPADGGRFVIRVAFTSRDRFETSGARLWTYFDISPSLVGLPDMNFDYPQLTVSPLGLYLTANIGDPATGWIVGAAIFRFRVGELARLSPGVVHFDFYVDREVDGFGGAPHSTGELMFWAGHKHQDTTKKDARTLRTYRWGAHSSQIGVLDIAIPWWSPKISSYTHDGSDWLENEGGAITGACVGMTPVFGWTAGANPPAQPHAYIYLVQLHLQGVALGRSKGALRYIWNSDLAWAKPTLGVNALHQLGMTCAFGGPKDFVGTTVGFMDLPISPASSYDNVVTAQGTRGAPRWGDFMSIRNHPEYKDRFISTGYTIHEDPQSRPPTETRPRYTIFSS